MSDLILCANGGKFRALGESEKGPELKRKGLIFPELPTILRSSAVAQDGFQDKQLVYEGRDQQGQTEAGDSQLP